MVMWVVVAELLERLIYTAADGLSSAFHFDDEGDDDVDLAGWAAPVRPAVVMDQTKSA